MRPTISGISSSNPSADLSLTRQSLQDNRATIDNIRLWDWQPLLDTYAQLQEIRTYYKFHDADIDRYVLGGSYQQVMLSTRELDSTLLPPNAQSLGQSSRAVHSWQWRRDVTGHAYIGRRASDLLSAGHSTGHLRRAAVASREYISARAMRLRDRRRPALRSSTIQGATKMSTALIMARMGSRSAVWRGARSVSLVLFGIPTFCSANTSQPESRIMFRRNIQERVAAIAPFLRLDHDPYIVVSGGQLYWIQDAYTTSSWFPYARRLRATRPITSEIPSRSSSMPTMAASSYVCPIPPIRSSNLSEASSQRSSSRLPRCPPIYRSTLVIRRICFS